MDVSSEQATNSLNCVGAFTEQVSEAVQMGANFFRTAFKQDPV